MLRSITSAITNASELFPACNQITPIETTSIQALWKSGEPYVRGRKFLSWCDWVDLHRNIYFGLFCIANSDIACWAWQTHGCDHPMLFVVLLSKLTFHRFSFCGGHWMHRRFPQPKGTGPYPLKLNWIGRQQFPVFAVEGYGAEWPVGCPVPENQEEKFRLK